MKDKVIKNKSWEFDKEVTSVFDNMLERSIPQYEQMRLLVSKLSSEIINDINIPTKTIIDIGCSKGRALESIYKLHPSLKYIGIEYSKPMYDYCVDKWSDKNNVSFLNTDLCFFYPNIDRPDNVLCLSILTLCFIPIEYRSFVLTNIYNSLCKNGSLIIVEKCLSNNYATSNYIDNIYYDMKKTNGYTQEQIASKRKSLEGVLVPLQTSFNEELFRQVGFNKIDVFWKYLNFTGWVLIK